MYCRRYFNRFWYRHRNLHMYKNTLTKMKCSENVRKLSVERFDESYETVRKRSRYGLYAFGQRECRRVDF